MKNILLTGHTKGIGKATLNMLLDKKINVTGIARNLTDKHINLTQLQYDLGLENDIKLLCKKLADFKFDCIILNAGYNDIKPADAYPVDEIIRIININLSAHAAIIRACLPGLLQKQGTIIGIGSYSGTEVARWNNFYGSAKAGFHHLLKNIFEQYRKQGLRVTNIIPDITNSDFYKHQQFEPSADKDTCIKPEAVAEIITGLIINPLEFVPLEMVIRPQRFELNKKPK